MTRLLVSPFLLEASRTLLCSGRSGENTWAGGAWQLIRRP